MAKFERPRKREPRSSSPRREGRGRSFDDGPRNRRDSGRSFSSRRGSSSRDFQKTRVTCSSCGEKCEVPFKPTSSKPVYCDDCFSKKDKSGSRGSSGKDFAIINEKLDKIMKALDIE